MEYVLLPLAVVVGLLVGLAIRKLAKATTVKRCTQCAETIQKKAVVCRFCGAAQPPATG